MNNLPQELPNISKRKRRKKLVRFFTTWNTFFLKKKSCSLMNGLIKAGRHLPKLNDTTN